MTEVLSTEPGPGVRATYRGMPGTIEGESSLLIHPDGRHEEIWHLVYDRLQRYGGPCGCCRPFGTRHAYRGVYTTAAHLVIEPPIQPERLS